MLNRTRKPTIVNAGTEQLTKTEDYCSYFGLSYPPFNDLPEVPKKVFQSASFSNALLNVLSGIKYGKTIAFLSGDKGTGKTTFFKYCKAMLKPHYAVAAIIDPRQPTYKILASICNDLDVRYPASCKDEKKFVDNLKHYLLAAERRKERTFIIFDEAENLSSQMILCLDPLLKLNQLGTKKLHIIFMGGTGLQKKIAVQLSQQKEMEFPHDFAFSMENSSFHGRIKPLTKKETIGYIKHKLKFAGAFSTVFTKAAISTIHGYSGGTPQTINSLCDKSMRISHSRSKILVDYSIVRSIKGSVILESKRLKPMEKLLAPFISCLGFLSDTAFKTSRLGHAKPFRSLSVLQTVTENAPPANNEVSLSKNKSNKYPKELLSNLMPQQDGKKKPKSAKTNNRGQKALKTIGNVSRSKASHSPSKGNASQTASKTSTRQKKDILPKTRHAEDTYPTKLLTDLVAKRHSENFKAPQAKKDLNHSEAVIKSENNKVSSESPYEHAVLAAKEQSSSQFTEEKSSSNKKNEHQYSRDLLDDLITKKKTVGEIKNKNGYNNEPDSEESNVTNDSGLPLSEFSNSSFDATINQPTSNNNNTFQVSNKREFLFTEELVGDLLLKKQKTKKPYSPVNNSKTTVKSKKSNYSNSLKSLPDKSEIKTATEHSLNKKKSINTTSLKKWRLNSSKLFSSLKTKKNKHNKNSSNTIKESKSLGMENKKNIPEKQSSSTDLSIDRTAAQSFENLAEQNQVITQKPTRKSTLAEVPKGMVSVPEVLLASPNDKNPVTVPPFLMDETPVTNSLYAQFIDETGYQAPEHWFNNLPPRGMLNHPVVNISLVDAHRFAQWSGKRLPFPDEWEAAARGKDNLNFPWGDEWDSNFCNCQSHGFNKTMPVDAFPNGHSQAGCIDMIGNVWEWTAIPNKQAGLEQGYGWVFGGSFRHPCNTNENISRSAILQNNWYSYVGFRCAMDIK